MPVKVYLDLPQFNGDFRAMPAYIEGSAGVKWVNAHPSNPERHGLPSVLGLYILSDPVTAQPLAVMDATLLTAMRTGAGLVTLATAQSLQPILAAKLTEATYAPLPEAEPGYISADAAKIVREQLADYDVLLIGCGLSQHPAVVDFVRDVLFKMPSSLKPKIVIDADALNALAQTPDWWKKLKRDAILTPHPGEMSRLSNLSVNEIAQDRLGAARGCATKWNNTVILKGANSIIASPDGKIKINAEANAGLASAGTGDVLAGTIAGLLAQGQSYADAAACGAYLHTAAANMVSDELGDAGMIASDLLPALPKVIKNIKESIR